MFLKLCPPDEHDDATRTAAAAFIVCAHQMGFDADIPPVHNYATTYGEDYAKQIRQERSDPDAIEEAAMNILGSLGDGTAKGSLRRDYEKLCPKAKQKDPWWRAYAAFNLAAQQAGYDTDDHENIGQFADNFADNYEDALRQ